ncbi:MAG: chromate efflux transporter [Chthoniobacterales bacterium]
MRIAEVFRAFLKLGLTSFGGPVAHLGFFRDEFVIRRKWLSEAAYADIIALCQFLPGPASSQAGIALGHLRAGLPGSFAAWLGFTLPSAILMIAFAYGMHHLPSSSGWLRGLKIAAVAVVAQAVWNMAPRLCTDFTRRAMAALAAVATLIVAAWWMQLALIAAGLIVGAWKLRNDAALAESAPQRQGRAFSVACIPAFLGLFVVLPFAASGGNLWLEIADRFYRAGALVFGGGHVVLPLLESGTARWVSHTDFLAGYGAAQALPGPLFSFAAYLGALIKWPPWLGGIFALVMIYLPSFLLVLGTLPHWQRLRSHPRAGGAMGGANAVVVGLLLAALIQPVGTSAITSGTAAVLAAAAFAALQFGKVRPWLLVLLCAVVGGLLLAD